MKQPRANHGHFSSRPLPERFAEKFIQGGADECWPWLGARAAHRRRNETPYFQGRIIANGKTLIATRVAWELQNGPIRAGLHVLHRCDNSLCVNPNHLFLGTNAENILDKVLKGRSLQGEAHHSTNKTESVIRQIHDAKGTCSEVGRRFGISRGQVSHIRREESWRHLWRGN